MFSGFNPEMIPFLIQLRLLNDAAYYNAHKAEYNACVRDPYYAFIEASAPVMLSIDPAMDMRPARCLSRIRRDTRFSHDKSLYRDHHWVQFYRAGEQRDGALFYWFEIRPGGSSWGVGFWGDCRASLNMLRARMQAVPDEMLSLLNGLDPNRFSVSGERFKRLACPPGLPDRLQPLYTAKSLYIEAGTDDLSFALSPGIHDRVMDDFVHLAPFYHYLRARYDDALHLSDSLKEETPCLSDRSKAALT